MARERQMPMRRRQISEREQLDLFRALPGDLAPRDAQDLMAYPFFSLAKSKRVVPIDFRAGKITIRVEAVAEHGMATIWDANVLIWAASQIVEARDAGLKTSRLMAATPYEILTFVGRGTGARDYDRLKAALDRLQSTTVMTSTMPLPASVTVASLAAFLPAKPNWTRQRNTMLVTMRWRRQTSATLMPGCSDSNTTASFSSSVKLRRFERPSCGGSGSRAAVKSFSGEQSLAALLAPVLVCRQALG